MGMKRADQQLEYYLQIWGEYRAKPIAGLSYPSMTAEARLTASPGRSTGGGARVPAYWPDPVAVAVERAMDQIQAKHQIALWTKYVQQMPERKAAIVVEVETQGQYRAALDRARDALGEAMGLRRRN